MTDIPDVNSTRLKERLLSEIPGLVAHKKGRDVLLAFEKDVGPVLSEASSYSDAIILAKPAKILRKHMVEDKCKFQGNLSENSVYDSLPSALLQFVCIIEHGADIKSQIRFGATTTDLAMAQLLYKYKEGAATQRHSRDRETPLPIYIGMSVHAKTRKRHLVEMLRDHAFQAACIWGQATGCNMQSDSPANWGWQKNGQVWEVLWSTLPPIAQSCQQLSAAAPVNVGDHANATATP